MMAAGLQIAVLPELLVKKEQGKNKKAAHIGFGPVTSEIELAIRPARGGSLPYLSLSGIEGDELGATGIFPTFCLIN